MAMRRQGNPLADPDKIGRIDMIRSRKSGLLLVALALLGCSTPVLADRAAEEFQATCKEAIGTLDQMDALFKRIEARKAGGGVALNTRVSNASAERVAVKKVGGKKAKKTTTAKKKKAGNTKAAKP